MVDKQNLVSGLINCSFSFLFYILCNITNYELYLCSLLSTSLKDVRQRGSTAPSSTIADP